LACGRNAGGRGDARSCDSAGANFTRGRNAGGEHCDVRRSNKKTVVAKRGRRQRAPDEQPKKVLCYGGFTAIRVVAKRGIRKR
jgi:hypothetical protein